MMKKMSIAIDGPASSGKSTVAKIIAKELGYIYSDTGAMYRAVTYLAIKNKVDFADELQLVKLILAHPISFKQTAQGQLVFVDQEDVTERIRQTDVSDAVSIVAAQRAVRAELVSEQQKIAQAGGIVMDGRDIGTTVLPNAEVKIFLVASVEERAERRYKENMAKGIVSQLAEIKESISNRDYLDSHRTVSPLVQARDAVLIDTTGLSILEVVAAIKKVIAEKMSNQ
jgi:cytidylate kinase